MVHGLFLAHCAIGDDWLWHGWICLCAFVHDGLGHPDSRSKWDSSAIGVPGIHHKPKDSKQSSRVLVALLSLLPLSALIFSLVLGPLCWEYGAGVGLMGLHWPGDLQYYYKAGKQAVLVWSMSQATV